MKQHPLQEIAKFASGLVVADFFSLLWFSQQGLLPMQFMGATITPGMVFPGLVFDICLFLILIHYGWHIGTLRTPRERTYLLIAGVIFTVVGAAHLWRVFSTAPLVLLGWSVPLWLSWFAVAVTAYLAYASFHFALRLKK